MICVRCCHSPSTPYSMCHWLLGWPEDEGCLVKVCIKQTTVLEESLNSQIREDVLNWDRWEPNETWPSFSPKYCYDKKTLSASVAQALCVLSIQLKQMNRRTNFRVNAARGCLDFWQESRQKLWTSVTSVESCRPSNNPRKNHAVAACWTIFYFMSTKAILLILVLSILITDQWSVIRLYFELELLIDFLLAYKTSSFRSKSLNFINQVQIPI